MPDVVVEATPRSAYRLPVRIGRDGVTRRRRGGLLRVLHVEGVPVVLRAWQPAHDRVVMAARSRDREAAGEALRRWRFALGVDDDLEPFFARFRCDPLIGHAVRRDPTLRVMRRPEPFEALAWAITEQLIELERAEEIQRRILRRLGRRCPQTGLPDLPSAATLAGQAPARLASLGLTERRAALLVRVAREVAAGRIVLDPADPEPGWRRLRAIPGIGPWTVEMLALYGQGRLDRAPAGDLGYLKLVGRLITGRPRAVASEDEVRALLARYDPYAGQAAAYLPVALRPLLRAGTRWSPPPARSAAA